MLAIEAAHDSAVRARKRLVEDDAEPNLIRALDTTITTRWLRAASSARTAI